MTLLSLVVGGRDFKKDGFFGATLFDVEDSFPIRIDPPNEDCSSCAATDLRYLIDDERAVMYLDRESLRGLYEVVSRWDIPAIIQELSAKKIQYADTKIETAKPRSSQCDEGGHNVSVQKEQYAHPINGKLNQWKNNPEKRVLNQAQLAALSTRMTRAKECIELAWRQDRRLNAVELLCAVDPYARKLAAFYAVQPDGTEAERARLSNSSLALAGYRSPSKNEIPVFRRTPLVDMDPLQLSFSDPKRRESLNTPTLVAQFQPSPTREPPDKSLVAEAMHLNLL